VDCLCRIAGHQQSIAGDAARGVTLTAVLLGMTVGQFLVGAWPTPIGRKFRWSSAWRCSAGGVGLRDVDELTAWRLARFVQGWLGRSVSWHASGEPTAFEGRAGSRLLNGGSWLTA